MGYFHLLSSVFLSTTVVGVLLWAVAVGCTTPPSADLIPTASATAKPSPTSSLVSTPSTRPTVQSDSSFAIQLQSRQFTPGADLESGLDLLRSASTERVHVLLQLWDAPDSAAATLLAESGIRLLNYIPHKAWFASVPRSLKSEDPVIPLIRWIGAILPEDKVPSEVLRGQIGTWALRERNRVALDVSFFEDVGLSEGERIILGYGGEAVTWVALSNKLTVEIPRESIALLAAEDGVRWIDVVPPPPTTHSEGG